VENLLRRLSRTGLRRGFSEGSRGWMFVGVSATMLRLARRALVSKPEVIFRTELEEGEALEILTSRGRRGRGA
jgi:hypothetical protein